MPIPELVQALLEAVLDEVEADPKHMMSPQRRREIYNALSNFTGQQTSRWLAVITAKRVLPVFQQSYPDNSLPQELLETAIGVLQGQVDNTRAEEMLDRGYHASGNAWGYDEREIPWPVWLAGNASYHALKEVCCHQPLSNLPDHYYKNGVLTPWSDEELCESPFADTAAVAAITSASDSNSTMYDSKKLQFFWNWWVVEAIPTAVEVTQKG
jgi:hypothetical protein